MPVRTEFVSEASKVQMLLKRVVVVSEVVSDAQLWSE